MTSTETKFHDLGEDTLDAIKSIIDQLALPFNLKIKYLGDPKQKRLIKLQKTNKVTEHLTAIDLVIFVNEDYFIKLESKNAEILLYQEIDRLQFDINKGTFKIAKFPLQTTTGVLKKFGIDAVAEANELSDLYTKQQKDGQEFDPNAPATKAKAKRKKDLEFLN